MRIDYCFQLLIVCIVLSYACDFGGAWLRVGVWCEYLVCLRVLDWWLMVLCVAWVVVVVVIMVVWFVLLIVLIGWFLLGYLIVDLGSLFDFGCCCYRLLFGGHCIA